MADPLDVIANRRNRELKKKEEIWRLIDDSYVGGDDYTRGNHLDQYPREPQKEYEMRVKRATYFNHVQPMADMMAGFIVADEIKREIPPELEFVMSKISKNKGLDSFMATVRVQSLLHTIGILVDSPRFAPESIVTEADRASRDLNPYCVIYWPEEIRDYSYDSKGELQWVLLDNSYTDDSNPMAEAVTVEEYRLWTKTQWQDFTIEVKDYARKANIKGPPVPHNLGRVPFVFVNWKDKDDDLVSNSIFEDIALLDKKIYNTMSYLDEVLASGTFKLLFFPVADSNDLPSEVISQGVGALSVIPFQGNLSKQPYFDGAGLQDIQYFLSAVEIYLKEQLSKVGMDKDTDKDYVQSGKAKSKEFIKCEALLRAGAVALENCEREILVIMGLWLKKKGLVANIVYPKSFQQDEIQEELARLYEALQLRYNSLRTVVVEEIIRKLLSHMEQGKLEGIIKNVTSEIEEEKKEQEEVRKKSPVFGNAPVTDDMMDDEKASRKNQPPPQAGK